METTETIATLLMAIECHEADMNRSELEFFDFCAEAFDADDELPPDAVSELEELLEALDERAGFWNRDAADHDYGYGYGDDYESDEYGGDF